MLLCLPLGCGNRGLDGGIEVGDGRVLDDAVEDVTDLPDVAGQEQSYVAAVQVFCESGEHACGGDVDEGDRLGVEDDGGDAVRLGGVQNVGADRVGVGEVQAALDPQHRDMRR